MPIVVAGPLKRGGVSFGYLRTSCGSWPTLETGAYYLNMASNELLSQYKAVAPIPKSFFTPEGLGQRGRAVMFLSKASKR